MLDCSFKRALCALALAAAGAAQAAVLTVTDTTIGSPTWTRPIQNGGLPPVQVSVVEVGYDVVSFVVDTSGTYNFYLARLDPFFDPYLFLYKDAFDPAAPLANVLIGNDDTGIPNNTDATFDYDLIAGTSYFAVATGFLDIHNGPYTLTVSGPGNFSAVVPGTVPESGTLALASLALAGAVVAPALSRRRAAGTGRKSA